ncbi:efflux RND transporter periplasmic adaptor subunit [Evansella cellulosilytica]|uniref:Efflux transporter, RND family, MFP subunit n=1 Tax=Evansella cellulosilytica (strain ATCC 21833 / DSM 2522 / FERM P-1141 / JCM 9156 / N-4) TaxID=649639 RepID=E6TSP2_EVAC2|nr:efflux RND transporter periplasmic adaptor subunit [Evansella cellulosilytica]ADU29550.1 efflux transporter, RND family, MFP subunit [Evansella cellulosilytica DSM 2522]
MKVNLKRLKVITVSMLASTALLLAGCNGDGEDATAQADSEESAAIFPVEIGMVEKGILSSESRISGNVMAEKHMPVLSMLTGEVTEVHISNGDIVEKGDILIELNATDMELNISQARAGLQAAEANYNSAKSMREQGIKQAELQLEQAEDAYDMLDDIINGDGIESEQDLDLDKIPEELQEVFTRILMSNNNMPTERDLSQAEMAVKQAEIALEQAQSNAQVEAAEASVKQAEISLEMAESQKTNAVITAPMSGEVTNFNTIVGETVSPQAPLMQLVKMDEPIVRIDVNESMLPNLEVDQEINIFIPSYNKTYEGVVKYISIMPGEQSRSYPVEIGIVNPDHDLRIGMHAQAVLNLEITEEQLLVPVRAVVDENGEKYVYVTSDGERVEQRLITIGNETSDLFEVVSGLQEGEFIVENGIHQLYDGANVNVRNGEEFGFSSN